MKKIILVEDDAEIREVFQMALNKLDYEVVSYADANSIRVEGPFVCT